MNPENAIIVGISYRESLQENKDCTAEVEVQMPGTSSWCKTLKIEPTEKEHEIIKKMGIEAYSRYVESLKGFKVQWYGKEGISATTHS